MRVAMFFKIAFYFPKYRNYFNTARGNIYKYLDSQNAWYPYSCSILVRKIFSIYAYYRLYRCVRTYYSTRVNADADGQPTGWVLV